MFIAIYITFVIINLIVCSIITYNDYKNYTAITVSDIVIYIGICLLSFISTTLFVFNFIDNCRDFVVFQRKKKNER